jgi:cysteinyl-tRNA synthetase
MSQIAVEMTADYLANLKELGVNQIDHLPRATDHIDNIIQFIQTLEDKGFAYFSEGDVFFDVNRDPHYGQLSNRTADQQQGEGGEAASRKRSPGDFALWKSAKPGEPSWGSPWGEGRPGWHIECSAMSRYYLGETFDIHGGGLDLMFPHHENERAQSSCCHNAPMVKYWMHNGLMRAGAAAGKLGGKSDREGATATESNATIHSSEVADDLHKLSKSSPEDGAAGKISRSKGAGGLADLIRKHTGERIRFFLLRTHYRSTIIFNDEALQETGTALEAFYRLIDRLGKIIGKSFYDLEVPRRRTDGGKTTQKDPTTEKAIELRSAFLEFMDDDFNTGGAVSILFDFIRTLNKHIDEHGLETSSTVSNSPSLRSLIEAATIFRELTSILGIFLKPPPQGAGNEQAVQLNDRLMGLLIDLRKEARAKKDFATSDAIRNRLTEIGVSLLDKKEGTSWELQR